MQPEKNMIRDLGTKFKTAASEQQKKISLLRLLVFHSLFQLLCWIKFVQIHIGLRSCTAVSISELSVVCFCERSLNVDWTRLLGLLLFHGSFYTVSIEGGILCSSVIRKHFLLN